MFDANDPVSIDSEGSHHEILVNQDKLEINKPEERNLDHGTDHYSDTLLHEENILKDNVSLENNILEGANMNYEGGISMFGDNDINNNPNLRKDKFGTDTSNNSERREANNAVNEEVVTNYVDEEDISNELNTLVSLTKIRPKIKKGRRPPSRATRIKNIEASKENQDLDQISDEIDCDKNALTETAVKTSNSKKPSGGVSMFVDFNPVMLRKHATDIEPDTSVDVIDPIYIGKEVVPDMDTKPTSKPQSFDWLASDESDDDLFVTKEKETDRSVSKPAYKSQPLFGSDDSDDDLFNSMARTSKPLINTENTNIFDEDSDDDCFLFTVK